VINRATQSALLAVGAAAGVAAAATWLNRRRLTAVNTSSDERIEPESAELPVGRSADPDVDGALSRKLLPQDDTSGAALYAEREPPSVDELRSESLDDIWNAPGIDEGERGEGYDAVNPESLGAVWLERATQTTHDPRHDASDSTGFSELDELTISEATRGTSGLVDDENEDDVIEEDALGDDVLDEGEDADEADEAAENDQPREPNR
jgi:hypothetical protein